MADIQHKEKAMERMWYYMDENRQMGPVPQVRLADLLQQGIIQKDTYVWTEAWPTGSTASGVDFIDGIIQTPHSKRPTSVTVFRDKQIVFGALGLLCSPLGIIGLLIPNPVRPHG
jgi:hypothetical protein